MPVLNDVKNVWRGSSLARAVWVGAVKIWSSKKIVGWTKIAGPYTITSVSKYQKKVKFTEPDKDEFTRLAAIKDLYVFLSDEVAHKVTSITPSITESSVSIDVAVTNDVATVGSTATFYTPVWG